MAGTAAALLIAVSYISFQSLRKDDYDRKVDEIAERVGYPSRDFHEIMRVKKEGYRPNDADWDELLAILNRNTGTEMLQMALGNLKKFRGTRHEAEAVQIAKTHISHNDPFVRGTALAVYWRLEAKDWPIVMKQAAVSDEDKFVRDFAAALIHEGDPSKSKGLSTPMPDPMKNGG